MLIPRLLTEFAQDGVTKSLRLGTIEELFVKCAVRANPRTEGNVDVDMADCGYTAGRYVMRGTTHRFALSLLSFRAEPRILFMFPTALQQQKQHDMTRLRPTRQTFQTSP